MRIVKRLIRRSEACTAVTGGPECPECPQLAFSEIWLAPDKGTNEFERGEEVAVLFRTLEPSDHNERNNNAMFLKKPWSSVSTQDVARTRSC